MIAVSCLLDPAVLRGELVGNETMHGIHNAFGDVGKSDARLLRRNRAGENAGANQEQAFLAEQPQPVEEILIGVCVLQGRSEAGGQFL